MYVKEKVQPNKVNAATLFIGVGGIGSKIIKGVADRCNINCDDTSNIRFVVMDTDVNDLLKVNAGAQIIAIQTSSTSSVENYLNNDKDAKHNWFPENKMLDSKTVSEGAGQVRAISRLALNDIIKNGRIHKLYSAIDDLFLKDGGGLKQAIRVVVASTAAGGTGSGIAMAIAMVVRHYIKKNYPEAAAMIRGFLVMPGVMDTVITTQSERDSLRCNGYATIKEINAFMMKGSGFFDTVSDLQRYKDLAITIPSSSSGEEVISNLPFDFCFLMDRTDSNAGNMTTLPQYINYASQSLYEQNVGPMGAKASSKEDNVLKLCIDPDKLGRCRFAGSGASVLRYPYEDIRDYIALNWARYSIIGSSSDRQLSEQEKEALLNSSWLQYDKKFEQEHKNWDDNPGSSARNEPTLAGVYMSTVESGRDPQNGNDFTMMLWDKFLTAKTDLLGEDVNERTIASVAQQYINSLVNGVVNGQLENEFSFKANRSFEVAGKNAQPMSYTARYDAIYGIEDTTRNERFKDTIKSFAKEVFSSKAAAAKEDLGEYMLERYLAVNGNIMHPNAARYMLYKLIEAIDKRIKEANDCLSSFESRKMKLIEVADTDDGKKSDDKFEVAFVSGHEQDLRSMCEACDKRNNNPGSAGERCNDLLKKYYKLVDTYFDMYISKEICSIARDKVTNLIKVYEDFYASFSNKIPSIEKQQEDIVTKLKFENGDCVRNIMCKKSYLDKLTSSVGRPNETGEAASKLYAKIFESLRNNSYIEARRNVNPFSYESKQDIFDDIIIEYYKRRVEESCEVINVKNVLLGLKLEFDVKTSIEIAECNEEVRDLRAAELRSEANLNKYILNVIETCKNLASPGIQKKDNEEAREVDAYACNEGLEKDGGGIRVNTFIPEAIFTPCISKYELRFYRAIYNVMPTQLSKLSAPVCDDCDEFSTGDENEYEKTNAGDYFRIYQRYMDRIGPDSKTSAIITPHIDNRWNAISSMPELDIEYQKRLMRKIHKSMLYGFVFDRIHLFKTINANSENRVYRYFNAENDAIDLVVSNKTKCDVLYEVLDALYFDRLAVSTIRNYVNTIRSKGNSKGFRTFEDIEFFKELKNFTYKRFTSNPQLRALDDQVSLFTVVLMYCNSLPVQNKDIAEMKIMVEAIIEIINNEMKACTDSNDSRLGKSADYIVNQYNMLLDNYHAHKDILECGFFSEEIIRSIRRTIAGYFSREKIEDYTALMNVLEED